MKLIHTCPICHKDYERDCTPEPDLPCDECIDDMRANYTEEINSNLPCSECEYLRYFNDCKLVCDEYKEVVGLIERLEIGL